MGIVSIVRYPCTFAKPFHFVYSLCRDPSLRRGLRRMKARVRLEFRHPHQDVIDETALRQLQLTKPGSPKTPNHAVGNPMPTPPATHPRVSKLTISSSQRVLAGHHHRLMSTQLALQGRRVGENNRGFAAEDEDCALNDPKGRTRVAFFGSFWLGEGGGVRIGSTGSVFPS